MKRWHLTAGLSMLAGLAAMLVPTLMDAGPRSRSRPRSVVGSRSRRGRTHARRAARSNGGPGERRERPLRRGRGVGAGRRVVGPPAGPSRGRSRHLGVDGGTRQDDDRTDGGARAGGRAAAGRQLRARRFQRLGADVHPRRVGGRGQVGVGPDHRGHRSERWDEPVRRRRDGPRGARGDRGRRHRLRRRAVGRDGQRRRDRPRCAPRVGGVAHRGRNHRERDWSRARLQRGFSWPR